MPLRIDDDVRNAAAVSKSQVSGGLPNWPPATSASGHGVDAPADGGRRSEPWQRDPYDSPPSISDPAPALVPVSPGGRATTTSGGRHAAPDAEQTTSTGLGGYLRRAAAATPVTDLSEYGRPPMPESPSSPAEGTTRTTYGGSWVEDVGATPESGAAPAVGSASVTGSLPLIGSTGVESGRRRAPESELGTGSPRPSTAGNSDAQAPRGLEADPEPLASRTPSPRRSRESEDAGPEPWWASRTRLVMLIVALVLLAAISVAIGIAAGIAHRNAEYSGATMPSRGVTVS